MALPTDTEIDAAVPVAGTPSRTLVNAAMKSMLAEIDSKLPAITAPELVADEEYDFAMADSGKTLKFSSASGCAIDASDESIQPGWFCNWVKQPGAGTLTFGPSDKVRALGGALTASSENAHGAIVCVGAGDFVLAGSIGTLTPEDIEGFNAAVLALVGDDGTSVVITGTGAVGQTLTATLPAGVTGDFQWTRDGVNITDATDTGVNSSDYPLVSADAETDVNVKVTNRTIGSTAVSIPAEVVELLALSAVSDNFSGGAIDTTKWEVGYWRGAASAQVPALVDGKLVIPRLVSTVGVNQNGWLSKEIGDFTGDRVFIPLWESSGPGNTLHEIQLAVFSSASEGLVWRLRNTLIASKYEGGAETVIGAGITFSPTTHYWLAIKHDEGTGNILWQTAPDTASNPPIEGDWVTQRTSTAPAGFTLDAARSALNAGTVGSSGGAASSAKFSGYNGAP